MTAPTTVVRPGSPGHLDEAGRSAAVDGLRALAALSVFCFHLGRRAPALDAPWLRAVSGHLNLGVHVFSRMITILTGQRITDPSSGYRAARADLLEKVVLKQDQFWTSEILIEALRHRARVVEVPVTFLARAGGESKKPKSFRYGWNFLKVIIQTWLR